MKNAVIGLLVVLAIAACDSQNRRDSAVVEQQQSHYARVQPIPFFDFSVERDVLIQAVSGSQRATPNDSLSLAHRGRGLSFSSVLPSVTELLPTSS